MTKNKNEELLSQFISSLPLLTSVHASDGLSFPEGLFGRNDFITTHCSVSHKNRTVVFVEPIYIIYSLFRQWANKQFT